MGRVSYHEGLCLLGVQLWNRPAEAFGWRGRGVGGWHLCCYTGSALSFPSPCQAFIGQVWRQGPSHRPHPFSLRQREKRRRRGRGGKNASVPLNLIATKIAATQLSHTSHLSFPSCPQKLLIFVPFFLCVCVCSSWRSWLLCHIYFSLLPTFFSSLSCSEVVANCRKPQQREEKDWELSLSPFLFCSPDFGVGGLNQQESWDLGLFTWPWTHVHACWHKSGITLTFDFSNYLHKLKILA